MHGGTARGGRRAAGTDNDMLAIAERMTAVEAAGASQRRPWLHGAPVARLKPGNRGVPGWGPSCVQAVGEFGQVIGAVRWRIRSDRGSGIDGRAAVKRWIEMRDG